MFTSIQRLIALGQARRRQRFASHLKSHGRPARDGRSMLHKEEAGRVRGALLIDSLYLPLDALTQSVLHDIGTNIVLTKWNRNRLLLFCSVLSGKLI